MTLRMQGAIALLLVGLFLALPARSQGLIRDAEMEMTLRRVAGPVFNAAGLGVNQVDILMIDNPRMNAFVAGGNNIFIHTGLMRRLKSADQLRAVIAHETAHITGGHLARRNEKLRAQRGPIGLGLLLAVAAAASGNAEAGIAGGLIGAQIAQRDLLAHSRAEESAADQAGLRYMVGAGADPRAILEVMRLFRGQDALTGRTIIDPYAVTHPIWSQRIRYLEDLVASAPKGGGQSAEDAYWYGRLVAKFDGFLGNPRQTLRTYADDKTEIGALARAVAYHRLPDLRRARAEMAGLLKARPNDPYYNELNGQFLLENRQVDAAIAAYRKAVSLAPNEALILSGLGRALVAREGEAATREAVAVLERARQMDDADPAVYRNLAVAYARLGQPGQASLATAERFALQGRLRDAEIHATRASAQLTQGSPGWRKAQDILRIAKRVQRN